MAKDKLKMSNKRFMAIMIPVIVFLVAAMIAVTCVMNAYKYVLDTYLGIGARHTILAEGTEDWDTNYYDNIYADEENPNLAAVKGAAEVSKKIADEGFVLLKNDNILPLKGDKPAVTPFGYRYLHPVYGIYGSGCVYGGGGMGAFGQLYLGKGPAHVSGAVLGSATEQILLPDALASNFTVNGTVVDKMSASQDTLVKVDAADGTTPCQEQSALSCLGANTYLYEFSADIYSDVAASCADTTGLVFIARDAGEGGDLKIDAYADGTPHQLALSANEKATIKFAKEHCDNGVVAIINSSNIMEVRDLMEGEYAVDAVLWVGFPGTVGFQSMSDILCGKVNPSGRTVDLWADDFTKNPTYQNFGDFRYDNVNVIDNTDTAQTEIEAPFVEYEEGVYVGYKYYETADVEDPDFDYEKEVVFPFGYGLSYTTFEQEITGYVDGGDEISVTVSVKNTGDRDGKEVVQLYYTAPYTDFDKTNKIEKPVKNLVAFDKVEVAKGATEEVTLTFAKEDMASYCYTRDNGDGTTGCYVLENGEYTITLGKNSHDAWDSRTTTINETVWYDSDNPRQSEKDGQSLLDDEGNPIDVPAKTKEDAFASFVAATNRFEDCNEYMNSSSVTNLSRSNWTGTFPTRPENNTKTASDQLVAEIESYNYMNFDYENDALLGNKEGSKVYAAEAPVSKADNGLTLMDMRGKDYYDNDWNLLLDQLDYGNTEQLIAFLFNAAQTINPIEEIGLTKTKGCEGPSGVGMFSEMFEDWGETMAYPGGMVIASSWNTDLAYKAGEAMGLEALNLTPSDGMHINGWTGPAMNLHRSPFGGRNGEYYSEDSFLSGMIGVQIINGAGDKGLYTIYKHFAVNDSETNRHGICTWLNEQAMRETYFKTFEIVFKESRRTVKYIADDQGTVAVKRMKGAMAVMTSMNRIGAVPAGGHYGLLTEVLRDEWGFHGFVQTDQPTQTDKDQMLRAGGDVQMSSTATAPRDLTSNTIKHCIRRSVHNVAFALVNSNVMQGVAPGTIIYYDMSPWAIGLMIGDIVVGLLIAGGIVWIVLRVLDEKKHPEKYKRKEKI